MHKHNRTPLFSAGDLVAFLECEHATSLALQDLETPLARAEGDGAPALVRLEGFAKEAVPLSRLKS